MPKRSNFVLLAVAMTMALLATLLIVRQLNGARTQSTTVKSVPIVVVVHALDVHEVVTSSDVDTKNVPPDAVPEGAVTSVNQVVGHYTATAWFPGQQVVAGMVQGAPAPASFPLRIPAGDRAFTVSNDPVTGVDHLISVGDRVDVLASFSDKVTKVPTIKTLLQNVLVLAVDAAPGQASAQTAGGANNTNTNGSGTDKFDTITIAVSPQQAQILDYGYAFGQLHIALRNPADSTQTGLSDVTISSMP